VKLRKQADWKGHGKQKLQVLLSHAGVGGFIIFITPAAAYEEYARKHGGRECQCSSGRTHACARKSQSRDKTSGIGLETRKLAEKT
jgi:hypothetical protein